MPAHITEYKMRQFTYNIKKAKIALHKLQIYLIGKPWWIGNQDQTAIITFSITRNGNETPSVMGLDTGDDVFVVASRTIGVPIYNNALWLQMSTIFVGKQMSMSWLHAGQMGRFRYKIFFFPRSHNFGAQPRFLIDIENFRGVEQFSIISFYYKSKGHLTDPNKCYLIGR